MKLVIVRNHTEEFLCGKFSLVLIVVSKYCLQYVLHFTSSVFLGEVCPAKSIRISSDIITTVLYSCSHSEVLCRFSIWNTMMGTSILSMPWALERVGRLCYSFLFYVDCNKRPHLLLFTASRLLQFIDMIILQVVDYQGSQLFLGHRILSQAPEFVLMQHFYMSLEFSRI